MRRDPSFDSLLGLNGQTYVVDAAAGLAVRFCVAAVPVSDTNPHGIDYQMALFGRGNVKLVGFENTQQMRKDAFDHIQRLRTVRAYAYRDAATLVEDFWDEVDAWLRARKPRR
ncbi:MAG: hypothetical protein H7251_04775 [Acetobacteraceae bacterium]|nr:hypothetical protein [Acetobacteraceae bacterium]